MYRASSAPEEARIPLHHRSLHHRRSTDPRNCHQLRIGGDRPCGERKRRTGGHRAPGATYITDPGRFGGACRPLTRNQEHAMHTTDNSTIPTQNRPRLEITPHILRLRSGAPLPACRAGGQVRKTPFPFIRRQRDRAGCCPAARRTAGVRPRGSEPAFLASRWRRRPSPLSSAPPGIAPLLFLRSRLRRIKRKSASPLPRLS